MPTSTDGDEVQLYNRALSATEIQAAAKVPGTGPISWWKADGNASDSVGPENGTPQGALTFVSCVHGQAFNFNGTDAAVSLPTTQLPTYPNPWSIAGWVTTTATDERYALFYANGTSWTNNVVSLGMLNGNLMTTQGGDNLNARFIADGAPHYVAVTFDGTATTSTSMDSWVGSKTMVTASAPVTYAAIGRSVLNVQPQYNNPSFWSGMIDDLQHYNRALSASDIQSLASNGLPTPTGPIAMWKGEGNVNDSIGSDNGTPQCALTYSPGVGGQAFNLDGSTAAGLIGNPLNKRTWAASTHFERWSTTSPTRLFEAHSTSHGSGSDGNCRWGRYDN